MTVLRVALPTQARILELFEYSIITGLLYVKTKRHQTVNGQPVQCLPKFTKNGSPIHARVRIDGKRYAQHRVIWKLVTGEEPVYLDHKNGDAFINAWHNLRVATQQQNCFNKSSSRSATSKHKGVDFNKRTNRWRARIMVAGKHLSLGYFKTAEEASEAYQSKARELHGEFFYGEVE